MVKTRAMVKKELAERKEAEAAQLYERIMCNLEKPITKRLMLLRVCGQVKGLIFGCNSRMK